MNLWVSKYLEKPMCCLLPIVSLTAVDLTMAQAHQQCAGERLPAQPEPPIRSLGTDRAGGHAVEGVPPLHRGRAGGGHRAVRLRRTRGGSHAARIDSGGRPVGTNGQDCPGKVVPQPEPLSISKKPAVAVPPP